MREDLISRIDATNKKYTLFTDVIEDEALKQFAECLEQESVVEGALMPDTHSGYVAPIGSVILTKNTIFPSFVGYDIGCGMCAVTLDLKADSLTAEQLVQIKNEILSNIPIGFERNKRPIKLPSNIDKMPMTDTAKKIFKDQGSSQLGTLGGGNHFIELGVSDKSGHLVIVIHSGSRGVGHKLATHHMRLAAIECTDQDRYAKEFDEKNKDWYNKIVTNTINQTSKNGPKLSEYNLAKEEFVYRRVRARVENIEDAYCFNVNSDKGIDYINDMNAALEFAIANRGVMANKIIDSIQKVTNMVLIPKVLQYINKNHNHAELYTVDGEDQYYVHRKGATQAASGMLGVIPGNMVDGSFIVVGKGSESSLKSSSHDAGRVLSRRRAKDELDVEEFRDDTKHLVSNHSDSNLDEAPKAYKNIFEVMDNQKDLVEVIDRVIPIINIKG